jgi:flagellar biosynthesis protein FlhG
VLSLAYKLVQAGKKVIILDFDFGGADIDQFCKASTSVDISDYVAHKVASIDKLIASTDKGFDIVKGIAADNLNYDEINSDQRKYLIELMNEVYKKYDYVLIDLSPGSGKQQTDFYSAVDVGIVVTTEQAASKTDNYRLIKKLVLEKHIDKEKLILVVNMASSKEDAAAVYEKIDNTSRTNLEYALKGKEFYFTEDKQIKTATNTSKLFAEMYPTLEESRMLEKLIDGLDTNFASHGVRSFLNKLLNRNNG